VRDAELFVCVQVDDGPRREALVRIASAVEPEWLDVSERVEVSFDPARGQVTARAIRAVGDLVLDEHPAPLPAADLVEACLVEAVAADLTRLPLDDDAVLGLRARLDHLSRALPELGSPVPDDTFLVGLLPALCRGARGVQALTANRLHGAIIDALPWPIRQALDREAPDRITVPSGSRIHLQWRSNGPPILAVRIQEVFGWRETPRVLGGRVPVLLHLLAPNRRPAQITEDLSSFWANTWPEVRSELRRRYPKHAWPDDPLTAEPETRPRRKR
jgi:ATP-dependent helicase HrpB